MSLSSSCNKSFGSQDSFKRYDDVKSSGSQDSFKRYDDVSDVINEHTSEVILKIDDNVEDEGEKRSFQFCTETVENPQLHDQGSDKQGEITLDISSEIEKVEHHQSSPAPPKADNEVKELPKVSFKTQLDLSSSDDDDDPNDDHISGQLTRRALSMSHKNSGTNKVSKGTIHKSILRTKSRLADPPLSERKASGGVVKLGQCRSGESEGIADKATSTGDDDDDDEDVPGHLKKWKCDALTLSQWTSLVLILAFLICTLAISKWKRQKLRGLHIWKWEVLVLVLICGRLASGWVIRLVVFCIERNFMLRKRVVYFVYALRKSVQNCLWLSLVLAAWHALFDKVNDAGHRFLWFVNKVLWCMLAVTLLWLVKTLIIKVLASSFHVKAFFDRIQDTLFTQYVIEMLSGPPMIEIQENQEEEEKLMVEISKFEDAGAVLPPDLKEAAFQSSAGGEEGLVKQSSGNNNVEKTDEIRRVSSKKHVEDKKLYSRLHKMNRANVSAWNMKRLIKLVRHGALTTLDEHLQGVSTKQISSEYEAKVAARKIFRNVARQKGKSKYIYMQDLLRFLGDTEAAKAMAVIEGVPESNKISKKDLKNWVVNAFRDRKALAYSLNDTKTAVHKLHHMVNVLVGIIIVVICLVILGVTSRQLIVAISSQLIVVTFIFGNTCRTVFEALIFLFVMHPFDVGDRCEIGGVQMVVEEMNILTTVFLRYDSQKIIYPNSTLWTMPIHNLYRSPDMDDAIDFWFHIATPLDKINVMKQRIVSYIDNKKDHWYSNPVIVTRDMIELNKIKISLWPTHKMNHQNIVERYKRRGLLIEEIVKIVKEMGIEYLLYPIDINIRNMPHANIT